MGGCTLQTHTRHNTTLQDYNCSTVDFFP